MKEKIVAAGNRIWRDLRNAFPTIVILFLLYIVMHRIFHAFCPSVVITGFPCPGCGLTRAVLYTLSGQFTRAVRLNASAPLWMGFAVYAFYWRYIRGRRVKGWQQIMMALFLFMLLSYMYRMITIFPGRPPYVYTSNNLMARILSKYNELVKAIIY